MIKIEQYPFAFKKTRYLSALLLVALIGGSCLHWLTTDLPAVVVAAFAYFIEPLCKSPLSLGDEMFRQFNDRVKAGLGHGSHTCRCEVSVGHEVAKRGRNDADIIVLVRNEIRDLLTNMLVKYV